MLLALRRFCLAMLTIIGVASCQTPKSTEKIGRPPAPFLWENATIYFLLTDRFYNADTTNDVNFERTKATAHLRGFLGGDIKGITQKINEGYFTELGVNAIWFTPVVEQIHGLVDEGFGANYGFHGYWTKDWTALDPNFGTMEDLRTLVQTAHAKGIRIILDVVLNHTGPVTEIDKVWPDEWVRTEPQCTYEGYESTITCTLVRNLPDIRTESNEEVKLPEFLIEKWKDEGRYEQEIKELDEFFARTGYPRAPRYYLIKWLTDYVKEFGVDGFRVDTAKHVEETVWKDLYEQVQLAFAEWKKQNPALVLDDREFFMMGEVYGYGISGGRLYNFNDKEVDFFEHGFKSLINFEFKYDAMKGFEEAFAKYDSLLHNQLTGKSIVNYISSHDDGGPFDLKRERVLDAGTKLLLNPGAAQIYYGDETGRPLTIEEAEGDAKLRSFMNWEQLAANAEVNGVPAGEILTHWQKLGVFRREHPAVGAGRHKQLNASPYVFSRTYSLGDYEDKVVVALNAAAGAKTVNLGGLFEEGSQLRDYYSGQVLTVSNDQVTIDSKESIVLLGEF